MRQARSAPILAERRDALDGDAARRSRNPDMGRALAYPTATLEAVALGHAQAQIDAPMPWAFGERTESAV